MTQFTEERRAAFQLIDCNGRCGSGRQPIVDCFEFILPEVKIILSQNVDFWDFECMAMGLTSWQRNESWRLLNRCRDDPRFTSLVNLIDRRHRIWDVMQYVLSQERRFVVAMLLEYYLAAWRNLMKSLQRKDRPILQSSASQGEDGQVTRVGFRKTHTSR